MYRLFDNVNERDKTLAIEDLIEDSTPRPSFFFLVICSVLMATFGLIVNNAAVVIGSMLIAPILSPILSLALGVVVSDRDIIARSFVTLVKSTAYGLGCAAIATLLFGHGHDLLNEEILSRTQPSIIYLMIAIVAGLATAFARVKPDLNEALPGTAIAVALMPPLAVSGIGIATLNATVAYGAFEMFLINAIGIIVAAMVMFSLMNFYTKREQASSVQDREDRKLEKEAEKARIKREREEKKKEAEEKSQEKKIRRKTKKDSKKKSGKKKE